MHMKQKCKNECWETHLKQTANQPASNNYFYLGYEVDRFNTALDAFESNIQGNPD